MKWCVGKDNKAKRVELATAGDDYELLFTARPKNADHIQIGAAKLNLAVTRVGKVTEGQGVKCLGSDGKALILEKLGYSHN